MSVLLENFVHHAARVCFWCHCVSLALSGGCAATFTNSGCAPGLLPVALVGAKALHMSRVTY